LTVNAAVYRTNWSDIQQGVFDSSCGYTLAGNFGGAVIKGTELEVSGQLTDRLSTGFSATYLHTELQDDVLTLGAFKGDEIEAVPNWQYAIYAQMTFPLLEADDGFGRLDYQYTGSSFANYNRLTDGSRDPASEIQIVRLLNLRTGMRHNSWEFALSGTNLLNETVRQSLDPNAGATLVIPGRPRYVMTRPRTFSFSVTYQFGQ
jgi:iron complex outermembrane receptor protein